MVLEDSITFRGKELARNGLVFVVSLAVLLLLRKNVEQTVASVWWVAWVVPVLKIKRKMAARYADGVSF